jgi:hypothetical protein
VSRLEAVSYQLTCPRTLLIEMCKLHLTFRLLYQTNWEIRNQNMHVQQVKLQISIAFELSNRSKKSYDVLLVERKELSIRWSRH